MSSDKELDSFHEQHPFPLQRGVKRLYKFMRFDDENPEYIEQLLVGLRLFHTLPTQFNDPFECRPHWKWPSELKKVAKLRKDFFALARRGGNSKKNSELIASKTMQNRKNTEKAIRNIGVKHYRDIRVCCFSADIKNILLWSHYADSHKGLCIAFDTSFLPLATCMKVTYQDEYPELDFPVPKDSRGFKPVLTKSKSWSYEKEYRSMLVSGADYEYPHYDEGYFLHPDSITDVYLGSGISEKNIQQVICLVEKSEIHPKIWQAYLADDSFSMEFREVN